MPGVLALIGNLNFFELAIVAVVAILVFGRRLPQVAATVAVHVGRFRRTLQNLWREAGIEQEIRNVRREMDRVQRSVPRELGGGARTYEAAPRAGDSRVRDVGAGVPSEAGAMRDPSAPAASTAATPDPSNPNLGAPAGATPWSGRTVDVPPGAGPPPDPGGERPDAEADVDADAGAPSRGPVAGRPEPLREPSEGPDAENAETDPRSSGAERAG